MPAHPCAAEPLTHQRFLYCQTIMKESTTMKKISHILPALALLSLPAFASDMHNHMTGVEAGGAKATAQAHKGQGMVNKLDVQAGIVNLTHGPIKSLGWSGMTMNFKVKDKAALDKIKAGMKVDFEVREEADGMFAITHINPAK
ncbi:MAG: copper-binding protein [Gammaproteobacteria bacterium]|nr:copper-binding protein [Gammaproteobacteria bacterium]